MLLRTGLGQICYPRIAEFRQTPEKIHQNTTRIRLLYLSNFIFGTVVISGSLTDEITKYRKMVLLIK
jgi:hypothetical protein